MLEATILSHHWPVLLYTSTPFMKKYRSAVFLCKKTQVFHSLVQWIPKELPPFELEHLFGTLKYSRFRIFLYILSFILQLFPLVVLGLTGSLRQYFSLYRAVFQREGEWMARVKKYLNNPHPHLLQAHPNIIIQISWTPGTESCSAPWPEQPPPPAFWHGKHYTKCAYKRQ